MAEVAVDEIVGGIKASKLRRPADQKAEEMRQNLTLPAVPSRELNDRQWEDYAKLLTPDMWTQISSMYLFRLLPKIIIQLVEPTNKYKNIDKLNRVVNVREHVQRLHGGGQYRVDVTQSKPKGEKALCQIFIDIPLAEVEPIMDYRMLDLSHPDNRGFILSLKARGIIDDRGNPMQPNTPAQPITQGVTGSDMIGLMKEMSTMFMKMSADQQAQAATKLNESGGLGAQVGTILLEQMKQNNPNQMLTAFAGLKDLFVKQGGGIETFLPVFMQLITQMMTMQDNNHKATLEMIKEMKQGKSGGDDTLGGLEKAMSIFEMMNNIRGDSGPRGGWDIALEAAKEIGLPVLQNIMQLYAISKGAPPQAGPTPPPTNPGSKVQPINGKQITTGDLARQAAREAATQKPAMMQPEVVQPEVINPTEPDPVSQQLQMLLQSAGGMIVEFMKQGRDGVDLAENVVSLYNKMVHAQISSHGEERLFNEIKAFPELWNQLSIYGEEKVKLFVHEFVNFEDLLANDPNYQPEEFDEDPIEVTTKPKRGKKS